MMKVGILITKTAVKKKAMIAPLAQEVLKLLISVLTQPIATKVVKSLAIQPITRAVMATINKAKEIPVTVYIKNVAISVQTILILTAIYQPVMSKALVATAAPAPNIKPAAIPHINTVVLMTVMMAMPTKTAAQEHHVMVNIKLVIANPDIIGMPLPVLVI